MAFPNFFQSGKCPDLKQAFGLEKPDFLQAYIPSEPKEKHPLAKVGGRVGDLLELFSLGKRLSNAVAQGAWGNLSYMSAGDKRLREARELLREYEIVVSHEWVDGHKEWWLEPSERQKLQTMLGV